MDRRADFLACEQTEEGARIATHCLYPSFESVRISVARMGDNYIVHDGSGAFNTAWLHARDEAMILNSLREACNKFHLALSNKAIIARIDSVDWLTSAILSVANASSLAAHDAVAKIVAAAEEALVDRIEHDLAQSFGPKRKVYWRVPKGNWAMVRPGREAPEQFSPKEARERFEATPT